MTARTGDSGRAEFTAVRPGARVKAVATVDGERLESREFEIPASGGIRVMLVASDPESAKRAEEDRKLAAGPARPGIVVLGEESRFVFELGDDGLSVFNIFQIMNTARTPVQTPAPVVFDLPEGAERASILDGSSPQAALSGRQVQVTGPFAPGMTLVQFAYSMPYSGSAVAINQRLPVALNQLSVMAQKVGNLHLGSPQMAEHRDMAAEGQTYIVGQGPALKAGDVVTFNFTGLPSAPKWPRNLALALATVILAAGAWAGFRRSDDATETARRRKLESKREHLFEELSTLEALHAAHRIDPDRYGSRRRELVAALERVYAQLDDEAVTLGRAS
jgi:hypothetical protein